MIPPVCNYGLMDGDVMGSMGMDSDLKRGVFISRIIGENNGQRLNMGAKAFVLSFFLIMGSGRRSRVLFWDRYHDRGPRRFC